MSPLVLLILAVVWAIFLVPQLVRARAEKTPADSIGAFRTQLSVLERATPAGMPRQSTGAVSSYYRREVAAMRRAEAARRRRDVLFGLMAAMAVTFLLGMLPAFRVLMTVHLVLDVMFFLYLGLLARARAISAERTTKVVHLRSVKPDEPLAESRRDSFVLLRNYGS